MRSAARTALLAVCALATPAGAHFPTTTTRGERTIELALNEAPIRLRYRVAFGPEVALEKRRRADGDGDGVVTIAEGNAALDAHSAALSRALRICMGASVDDVECRQLSAKQIELVEADGWSPGPEGHLHFAWTFDLGERAERSSALRLEDGWEPDGIEISEVWIEPPTVGKLIAAGEGKNPSGVARRLSFNEARRGSGARVITAVWPAPDRRWVTSAVLAAVIGLGVLLYWHSRRERPSTIG